MKFRLYLFIGTMFLATAAAFAEQDEGAPDIRPVADIRGHRETVNLLAFSPDGKMLASVGSEGQVYLWDVAGRKLIRKLFPKEKSVTADTLRANLTRRIESIAFSPDGKLLAEAAQETTGLTMLRLWNVETGAVERVLAEGVDNLRAIAYSPDGKIIAHNSLDSLGWKHNIVLRDPANGKEIGMMTDTNLAATTLVFSPDGKLLASAGGKKVHIWDVEQRKLLHAIDAHDKAIQSIGFSPNGKWVVSAGTDDKIKVWNVETGKLELDVKAEQECVNAVAFSPSGKSIVSGGKDRTIKLWKPKSGKKYARLWGHLDRVNCLSYNAVDGVLASGSGDSTIALWKVDEPDEMDKDEKGKKSEEDEWADDD